ncbi:MAG: peptidoglycan-binding protein [Clostridia bacterium]|nr:peptidoglycan-binding protein [Clostridia bacterium]
MSKHSQRDISMNSAFLESFRKRKNRLLSSEINFAEPESYSDFSDSQSSPNSAFLEMFRKRKKEFLSEELNIDEPNSGAYSDDRSSYYSQSGRTNPGYAGSFSDEFDTDIISEPELPYHRENYQGSTSERSDYAGRKHFNRTGGNVRNDTYDRRFSHNDADNLIFDSDDAIDFSDNVGNANNQTVSRNVRSDTQAKKNRNSAVVDSKTEKKSEKKILSKVILLLCSVFVIVCIFVLITKINSDSLVEEEDTSFSQSNTTSTIPETTESTGTATTENTVTSSTTPTTESTGETTLNTTAAIEPVIYEALSPGQQSDDVMKMQKRLSQLGYLGKKSCTGFYGEYTQKILKIFQEKAGLKQTGIADSETLARLYADDAPDCLK